MWTLCSNATDTETSDTKKLLIQKNSDTKATDTDGGLKRLEKVGEVV